MTETADVALLHLHRQIRRLAPSELTFFAIQACAFLLKLLPLDERGGTMAHLNHLFPGFQTPSARRQARYRERHSNVTRGNVTSHNEHSVTGDGQSNVTRRHFRPISSSSCSTESLKEETTSTEEQQEKELRETAIQVLDYLSLNSGKPFRHVNGNIQHIEARLRGGVTLDDLKLIVDHQCSVWKNDPKMRVYLRPETLFGRAQKFESYLAAAKATPVEPYRPGLKTAGNAAALERSKAMFDQMTGGSDGAR